jgi:chemotaxis protein MotB
MAGKGGGAWKVAYADFVTAMMAFFLVMWITAQSEQIKEAIAHHFNDPFAPLSEEPGEGAEFRKRAKHDAPGRLSHQDEREAGGGGRSLLLTNAGGERTSIGTIVYFAEESAELDGPALRRLAEFAPFVAGKPQRIEIRGHSTRRPLAPTSAFRDHWQLTYERCLAVMAALEELGIPRDRMRLSQAAGNEPVSRFNAKLPGGGNARVEVSLLNETAQPPIELQAAHESTRPNPGGHGKQADAPADVDAAPGGAGHGKPRAHGNAAHDLDAAAQRSAAQGEPATHGAMPDAPSKTGPAHGH